MCLNPISLPAPHIKEHFQEMRDLGVHLKLNKYNTIPVPCGKCAECLVAKNREWMYRIVDESLKYDKNCVITLTYNDNNQVSVSKADVQKFLKRFRKHFGDVRYFCTGEYGSLRGRPHYHIILFGYDFDDKYYWKKSKRGNVQYRSDSLDYLWSVVKDVVDESTGEITRQRVPIGFTTIGELDAHTAKYTALYLQKLIPVPQGVEEPFSLMSRNPGIGNPRYENIKTDKLYLDGKYIRLPRYYIDFLSKSFEIEIEGLKEQRARTLRLLLDEGLLWRDFADIEKRRAKWKDFVDKPKVKY